MCNEETYLNMKKYNLCSVKEAFIIFVTPGPDIKWWVLGPSAETRAPKLIKAVRKAARGVQ